jgi:nitroreductase
MEVIFQHKTIRKYKSVPIENHILEKVLLAATRASTTGNMQVYSIIVTTRPDLKQQLWEAHFKQNMVLQAPVLLTFCADFNRFNLWCKLRNAEPGYDNFLSFFTAAIDALLAAQNAALEAEYLGLGICYLGTTIYMAQQIIDILKLPKGVVPVTTLVVGYPDENPPLTDRLPLKAVIHHETYKNYTDQDINDIYREKENLSFYKELVQINKTETLAQIFTDKRYTKKDNIAFSKALLEVLHNQGFMNNE